MQFNFSLVRSVCLLDEMTTAHVRPFTINDLLVSSTPRRPSYLICSVYFLSICVHNVSTTPDPPQVLNLHTNVHYLHCNSYWIKIKLIIALDGRGVSRSQPPHTIPYPDKNPVLSSPPSETISASLYFQSNC